MSVDSTSDGDVINPELMTDGIEALSISSSEGKVNTPGQNVSSSSLDDDTGMEPNGAPPSVPPSAAPAASAPAASAPAAADAVKQAVAAEKKARAAVADAKVAQQKAASAVVAKAKADAAMQSSQALLQQALTNEKIHANVCVGYFKMKDSDQRVLAACAKDTSQVPEGKCPVTFDANTCMLLRPVKVPGGVTGGASITTF